MKRKEEEKNKNGRCQVKSQLIINLNPKKHDSVENISGIDIFYEDSTSKLIFDSYSSLAQSFVNCRKN